MKNKQKIKQKCIWFGFIDIFLSFLALDNKRMHNSAFQQQEIRRDFNLKSGFFCFVQINFIPSICFLLMLTNLKQTTMSFFLQITLKIDTR